MKNDFAKCFLRNLEVMEKELNCLLRPKTNCHTKCQPRCPSSCPPPHGGSCGRKNCC